MKAGKSLIGFISVGQIVCLLLIFVSTIRPQTSERKPPKIKDFGRSLEKQKNKPEEKKPTAQNPDKDDVIKVETNLVRTDVLVLDERGQIISGLQQSDFIVAENGVRQEISHFSLGENADVPRSIVLIIDYSGSQEPFIETSVEAAKILVSKLNPKDKMAIVTDDIELLTEFTNDKNLLTSKLDLIAHRVKRKRFGKSLQYSALMATLNELFDDEDIRPIVIFQTDGDEAFYISRPVKAENAAKQESLVGATAFTVQEMFKVIEKSRATIYSVVSGPWLIDLSPEERNVKVSEWFPKNKHKWEISEKFLSGYTEMTARQQQSMLIAARASGGFTSKLETPEQADSVYAAILNEINNRYLIGYYPANEEKDGSRRNVQIEVRGHPEYTVLGRKTYIASQK